MPALQARLGDIDFPHVWFFLWDRDEWYACHREEVPPEWLNFTGLVTGDRWMWLPTTACEQDRHRVKSIVARPANPGPGKRRTREEIEQLLRGES